MQDNYSRFLCSVPDHEKTAQFHLEARNFPGRMRLRALCCSRLPAVILYYIFHLRLLPVESTGKGVYFQEIAGSLGLCPISNKFILSALPSNVSHTRNGLKYTRTRNERKSSDRKLSTSTDGKKKGRSRC